MSYLRLPSFRTNILLAIILRLALIAYSEYYDARPDSNVKYTDVDYRVFTDAAWFVVRPSAERGNIARGLVGKWLGIGDPYERTTYRYTPLLAVLMTPNILLHSSFGKILFGACDILVALLLRSVDTPSDSTNARISLLSLFNPLIFSISTRGSSESILGALVLLTLNYAMKERWDATAIWFGVAVHWKIYPFIYGSSLLMLLTAISRGGRGDFGIMRMLRFAFISGGTFLALGVVMYAIWGHPFLEHTYLYHLTRRDHRHNFSPYFYPIYLALYNPTPPVSIFGHKLHLSIVSNSLLSFLPQMVLSVGSGFLLPHHRHTNPKDLPFVWFVQTVCFVAFNKVCTSQYFLWSIWFLPIIVPKIYMPRREIALCLLLWVGTQAIWLSLAYQLEFLGINRFLEVWMASVAVVLSHVFVLARMLKWYRFECEPIPGSEEVKSVVGKQKVE